MFKFMVISAVIVCCLGQLNIPKNNIVNRFAPQPGAPIPLFEAPVAVQQEAVAVAPAPAFGLTRQQLYGGQIQLRAYNQLATPFLTPITAIQTQQVLPLQELDVRGGPQLYNVRNDRPNDPVLIHFQTQSTPVQIQTSHIPSPQEEVTVTQTEDKPHRVIHEVIRPVIQEVREIIQPYRRVTQEIRPVEETIQTDVATNAAPIPVVVDEPKVAVVETPAPAVVAAPAPQIVEARQQQQQGAILVSSPYQYRYATPSLFSSNIGVIAAPAPLYTGSYIQQFVNQLRNLPQNNQLILKQQSVSVPVKANIETGFEPLASESNTEVNEKLPTNVGIVSFTRKYHK